MSDYRPCRECQDWKRCLLTESEKHWFGYQHITFCKHHIFFLLKYEDDIRGRAWPSSDEALGGSSNQTLSDAAWVSVSLLLAELGARLDTICPSLEGELLRDQCKLRDRVEYLSDDAKAALYYISGPDRRLTPFKTWRRINRFRYEKRNKVKIGQS